MENHYQTPRLDLPFVNERNQFRGKANFPSGIINSHGHPQQGLVKNAKPEFCIYVFYYEKEVFGKG
jgi:hypothetical protein